MNDRKHRDVLLMGGDADGRILAVEEGRQVVRMMRKRLTSQPVTMVASAPIGDQFDEYSIVQLKGSTRTFEVGVPTQYALDGDWLMEQLLNRYARKDQ